MGRPKLDEEPQKPRFHFGVSIIYEDRHIWYAFKKNCIKAGVPINKVILNHMRESNKIFEEELMKEKITNLPEEITNVDVQEFGQGDIDSDIPDESEEESINESPEIEKQEELLNEEIQEEIEEEEDVGS